MATDLVPYTQGRQSQLLTHGTQPTWPQMHFCSALAPSHGLLGFLKHEAQFPLVTTHFALVHFLSSFVPRTFRVRVRGSSNIPISPHSHRSLCDSCSNPRDKQQLDTVVKNQGPGVQQPYLPQEREHYCAHLQNYGRRCVSHTVQCLM